MNAAMLAEPVEETAGDDHPASLEACDTLDPAFPDPARYCPKELLETFALLMAGHGRCVNASMMLGDREYAMWQLACAQALPDEGLRRIAQRLFSYFDDPRGWAGPHRP